MTIDAPRQAVWSVLADLDRFADFSPMVRRVERLDGPRSGVGAGRRCAAMRAGHIDERVVDWEEGRRLALEVVGGMPIRGVGVWMLEGDRPTEVSFRLEYRPRFGPAGRLMDRVVMRTQMERGFVANLDGLRRLVEAGTAEPGGRARPAEQPTNP